MPRFFRRSPNSISQVKPAKLVVGLGNPGSGYSANRHNVGFMSVNQIAKAHAMRFDRSKSESRVSEGEIAGVPVMLARPQTFMNLSGKAVGGLMHKLKLTPEDVIVIHDDLDLPLGRIRIRKGGSSGGHNGIKSIIAETGSEEFIRIRIGIGRPDRAEASVTRTVDVKDHVLGDFAGEERTIIEETIPRVVEAVECVLTEGLVPAMNKFNASPRPPE
jgi:PTH1 family peptidyl-tRNA hydrolase